MPAAQPPTAPHPVEPPQPRSLFADWSDRQLTDLGVAEPLVPVIRALTTEDQLLGLVEYAPQLTGEVLLALFDGKTFDEVLEQVTAPVAVPEPVDPQDFKAAAERPATMVTTSDEALFDVLRGGDFGRWKLFLHPTQSKLVERGYSGPARVGGGPGTGKTVVALRRVEHLVVQLPPGRTKAVLLTTYNKNLAADLRSRLLDLGGEELLSRVEVSHVDQLALRIVREAEPGVRKQTIDDNQAVQERRALLDELGESGWDAEFLHDELGESGWDAEFLHDEWTQVILGQAVGSRTDYFRARRAGRGKTIGRSERAEIWQLADRFTQRLERLGRQTWDQVAERAARLEMEREQRILAIERQREEAGGLDNRGRLHARAKRHPRRRDRPRWSPRRQRCAHRNDVPVQGPRIPAVIIAGVSEGLVPREAVSRLQSSDPARYAREMQRARSLLFVATTRARDNLDIFWHGTPSPFLRPMLSA